MQKEDKGKAGQAAFWGAEDREPQGCAGLCAHRERDWLFKKGADEGLGQAFGLMQSQWKEG